MYKVLNNIENDQRTFDIYDAFVEQISLAKEMIVVSPYISSTLIKRLSSNLSGLDKLTIVFSGAKGDNAKIGQIDSFKKAIDKLKNVSVDILVRVYDEKQESKLHSKFYLFKNRENTVLGYGSSNFTLNGILENVENMTFTDEPRYYKKHLQSMEDILTSKFVIPYDKWIVDFKPNISVGEYDESINEENKQILESRETTFNSNLFERNIAQRKILFEMKKSWKNYKSGVVVAATGIGKSLIPFFDAIDSNKTGQEFKRILFHSNSRISINDVYQRMYLFLNANGYKTFSRIDFKGFVEDISKIENEKFVVFTNSEILSNNLSKIPNNLFDYVVFDEVHHVNENEYGINQKILRHFKNSRRILGLTATINRMDRYKVISDFEDNLIHDFNILKSIQADVISSFVYWNVLGVDFRNRKSFRNSKELSEITDDYIPEQWLIEQRVDSLVRTLEKIVYPNIEDSQGSEKKLKAIAFVESKLMAFEMSKCFNKRVGKNSSMTFTSDEKIETNNLMDEFGNFVVLTKLQDDNSELEIVFAVDRLNEGVDIPSINNVFLFRRTNSERIFIQQIGRGLRKLKTNPHKKLQIFDFVNIFEQLEENHKDMVEDYSNVSKVKSLINARWSDFRELTLNDELKELVINGISIRFEDSTNKILASQLLDSKLFDEDESDIPINEIKKLILDNGVDTTKHSFHQVFNMFQSFDFWRLYSSNFEYSSFIKSLAITAIDKKSAYLIYSIINVLFFGNSKAVSKIAIAISTNDFELVDTILKDELNYLRYELFRYFGKSNSNPKLPRRNAIDYDASDFKIDSNVLTTLKNHFSYLTNNILELVNDINKRKPRDFVGYWFRSHNIAAFFDVPYNSKKYIYSDREYWFGNNLVYESTLFSEKAFDFVRKTTYPNQLIDDKTIDVYKHQHSWNKSLKGIKNVHVFMRPWTLLRDSEILDVKLNEFRDKYLIRASTGCSLYMANANEGEWVELDNTKLRISIKENAKFDSDMIDAILRK